MAKVAAVSSVSMMRAKARGASTAPAWKVIWFHATAPIRWLRGTMLAVMAEAGGASEDAADAQHGGYGVYVPRLQAVGVVEIGDESHEDEAERLRGGYEHSSCLAGPPTRRRTGWRATARQAARRRASLAASRSRFLRIAIRRWRASASASSSSRRWTLSRGCGSRRRRTAGPRTRGGLWKGFAKKVPRWVVRKYETDWWRDFHPHPNLPPSRADRGMYR